jgi:hypothetical protein
MRKYILILLFLFLPTQSQSWFNSTLIGQGATAAGGACSGRIYYDTFTEASTTALESHTPDCGSGWSGGDTTGVSVYSDGTAYNESAFQFNEAPNSSTPTDADYWVEVNGKTVQADSNARIGVVGRYQNSTDYYRCAVFGTGTLQLWVFNSGGNSQIDTSKTISGFSASTFYTARLTMAGTTITCTGGGQTATGTDSTYSTKGNAGVYIAYEGVITWSDTGD